MKYYHGSPKKLKVLKPHQAKGINEFQNQKAVFLTRDFDQAALYAIGKSLKGKTVFALPPNQLIIVGDFKPKKGYVYEMQFSKKDVFRGEIEDYDFAYPGEIRDFKIHEVNPKDYSKKITYVKTNEDLKQIIATIIDKKIR